MISCLKRAFKKPDFTSLSTMLGTWLPKMIKTKFSSQRRIIWNANWSPGYPLSTQLKFVLYVAGKHEGHNYLRTLRATGSPWSLIVCILIVWPLLKKTPVMNNRSQKMKNNFACHVFHLFHLLAQSCRSSSYAGNRARARLYKIMS